MKNEAKELRIWSPSGSPSERWPDFIYTRVRAPPIGVEDAATLMGATLKCGIDRMVGEEENDSELHEKKSKTRTMDKLHEEEEVFLVSWENGAAKDGY